MSIKRLSRLLVFFIFIHSNAVFATTNQSLSASAQINESDTSIPAANDDWFAQDDSTKSASTEQTEASQEEISIPPAYPLLEIAGSTLLLYFITWLLVKFKLFKTSTHRKIWNMILLVSFLVSGLLGLMLVVQINYNVMGSWYSKFMVLHVEFGIVMALVSIFHVLWHVRYFSSYFKKRK